nr:hypothetical protein [Tanacetum cinerariifolium]
MSADVARSHGGDGGCEDHSPPHHVPNCCMGCFANRGKGKRKPNLGGRAAGRLNTRDKTRNLSLKEITDTIVSVSIQFELRDKQTVMPLGDHAAHWSSYIREVIRGVPLYYPSWLKVLKEQKATLITDIGMQTSTTQEYPSLINTFFMEEMRRLEEMGTYTDDEINRLARGDMFSQFESSGSSGSGGCRDDEEGLCYIWARTQLDVPPPHQLISASDGVLK